jgi:serine/threonine protein kinase/putative intracellular protease/amidase
VEVPEDEIPQPLLAHRRYKVLERIGEGGMGVVYRAEHRVMGRVVALKVLNTGVTSNPIAVERFRREVRLASRLNHANIVTAYDADEAGGLHFLVMEFVDGMSLEKLVRTRGPLPVALACECARQTAIGLQHAHEKGMIHRDIKPHNLMLTGHGQVKILDFGLACVAANAVDPASVTAQAITQPHTLLGTPDFLSPEQARSAGALDVRSDLYSLGCTLYFLLTGHPPYGGSGAYAKMIAHVKEPIPDLLAARPDAPPALAALLRQLMAKSPYDRYQTPTELAEALLPFSAPIKDPSALEGAQGANLENNSAITALSDTIPGCAQDGATSALPVAVECEPDAGEVAPVRRSGGTNPAPGEPVKKSRGLFALGAVVLVGLVGGGLAGQWEHIKGTFNGPQTAVEPPPAATSTPEPKSTSTSDPPHSAPVESGAKTSVSPPPVEPAKPAPKPVEPAKPTPPLAPPARKKQVLVLVPNDFAAGELQVVANTLKQHGAGMLLVAPEKKPLDGYRYGGVKVPTYEKSLDPELGAKEVTNNFLDAADAVIIVPGNPDAYGPKGVAGADFARIVKRMIQQKKVVGAIGSGIVALGGHGLLEHTEVSAYTVRPMVAAQLKVKKWTADPKVIIDLPIITAGELSHARALTEEVLKAIPDRPIK